MANWLSGVWGSLRNVWDNPESGAGGFEFNREPHLRLLWAMYDNTIFEDPLLWGFYRSQFKLYRQTRSLYNPMRRLVDFYAGTVYPGVLTLDGSKLPEGVGIAIPFAADTPEDIKVACGQFWQWSNFQSQKSVLVRYGAVAGSVLVEINDELEKGRVSANIIWAGLLRGIDLDTAGNVKSYQVRYIATDDKGYRYEYRKDVDIDTFRTYKDGELFDYGNGAVVPNPYGFVPAVWVKHKDIGSNYGAPAIYGSLTKIHEINSLASHLHDQVHKVIGAPILIAGEGAITNIFARAKRGATDELVTPEADRENVLMLKAPAGTTVASLAGNLSIAEAFLPIEKLIGELEQDHPELALYRELRAMSAVTGPGASRMLGDAAAAVAESSANYDLQVVKLFQMVIAIGGMRANSGDWGPALSRQQAKFLPFDLLSYERGQLDFDIQSRPLIPLTQRERIDAERAQLSLEADRQAISGNQAGIQQRIGLLATHQVAGIVS